MTNVTRAEFEACARLLGYDALRKKFHELWLSLYPHTEDAELNPVMPDGGYLDNTIDGAWLGFQLGHAAGMEDAAEIEIYIDPSAMITPRRRWHSEGVECLRGAIRAQAKGEKP